MHLLGCLKHWEELAAEMYSCKYTGEPHRFKRISIMGDSSGGSATLRSRGGVLSREGPFLEV